MESRCNIEQLPYEVRCRIWSTVGRVEEYSQLLRTSRLIRSDILSLIPGVGISCQCWPYRPCICGKFINVRRLSIIVEPDCSTRSWLKISVSMSRGQELSWKIGSLDDLLAQPLRYLRPKEIFIDFQAPKKGHYLSSFLILRAKLFDVCSMLDLVQAQQQRSLHLHFSDPWATSGNGPNTPFWENRPCFDMVKKDDVRRWYRRIHIPNLKMDMIEKRELFLYFYEMILTTFCMHWAWRNAKVTFDREPKLKNSSFRWLTVFGDQKRAVYHGVDALLLTAWAYTEQLVKEGMIRKSEEEWMPEFENYGIMRGKWVSLQRYHRSWKRVLEGYLNFVAASSEDFQRIMSVEMTRTANLPECIMRHFRASPRNAFSMRHPGSATGAGREYFEVDAWKWNHDIIRRRYQEWGQLWYGSYYLPVQLESVMFHAADDNSQVIHILYEDFRALQLRYTWPLAWRWQPDRFWKARRFLGSPPFRFHVPINWKMPQSQPASFYFTIIQPITIV